MNFWAQHTTPKALTLGLPRGLPTGTLLFFACALLLLSFFIDLTVLGVSLFTEGQPRFNRKYNLRTILIALSSWFFVAFIVRTRSPKGQRTEDNASEILNDREVILPLDKIDHLIEHAGIPIRMKKLITWVVFLVAVVFLLIFLTHPVLFYELGREDSLVETLSATFSFLACGLFVYIFLLLCLQTRLNKPFYLITSLLFASAFFLLGMEEVSWFQRVLSIDTSEFLRDNTQGELNLHNFATNYIENIYYFSSFVFLILLPFINDQTLLFKQSSLLSFFAPSRFILFVSAIFAAYNYDMWRILLTQLSFFMTLFILTYYAWSSRSRRENSFMALAGVVLYVLTQTSFLAFGDNFVRSWDSTEYKEFFIPLGYLVYAFEILRKVQTIRPSR